MILGQLFLFVAGFGFGVISRFVYVAVTRLECAIGLKVITIIFDIIMTAVGVISFSIMLFLINDGLFMPFIFIATIMGFVATSLLV